MISLAAAAHAQSPGTLTTLYRFTPPNPEFITQGRDGNFYTATSGGEQSSFGAISRVAPDRRQTLLHRFTGPDGATPAAAPILATDGNLYGTTTAGGTANLGTIYRISSTGELTTLHNFSFTAADGVTPFAGLIQAADGNFYGTTYGGGLNNLGTVFRMTADGTTTTLYSFQGSSSLHDGARPLAALIQGNDGNFYGTTAGEAISYVSATGQEGSVFRMNPDGTLTTLTTFGPSDAPRAALVQGADGNFYGTTFGGTIYQRPLPLDYYGSVFRVTPTGTRTILHTFSSTDAGLYPLSALVNTTDGSFYGTTTRGGTNGFGTIFQITIDGTFTVRHHFNDTGGSSPVNLIPGRDGNLYGTTNNGGLSGVGTVFQLTPTGSLNTFFTFSGTDGDQPSNLVQSGNGGFYGLTYEGGGFNDAGTIFSISSPGSVDVLHRFNGTDGTNPNSLLVGSDGRLYGTTVAGGAGNAGTVFTIQPLDGKLTTLHAFNGTDGSLPQSLIQANDGNFYGTTLGGGSVQAGTVFRLTANGTMTTLHSFDGSPAAGPAGLIQGRDGNFYGATRFNGFFFRLTPAGVLTILHGLASDEGFDPAGLIQADDGNFYGTNYNRAVFRFTPNGAFSILHQFTGTTLLVPRLIQASNGSLFGETLNDGANLAGRVFQLGLDGTLTTFHEYTLVEGTNHSGLMQASDGNFYGTDAGARTATDSGSVRTLASGFPQGVLRFDAFSYTVNENSGRAVVAVSRNSGRTGAVSVQYATADGTALAGTDYTATSGTLSWLDGDPDATKYIVIPVRDRGLTDGSTLSFTVALSAPTGGVFLRQPGAITVNIVENDPPPVPQLLLYNGEGTAGMEFIYQIIATNAPTSYGAMGLPPGLNLNTATGIITGVPTAAGTYSVTLSATNAGGTASAVAPFTVDPAVPSRPVITSPTTASGRVGSAFTYRITASNSPTRFAAAGLPPGLTIDEATGVISGVPTAAGTYPVTIGAVNGGGAGSTTLTVTVAPVAPSTPIIISPPTAGGEVGSAFTYQIAARNVPTSFAASGLPPGLAIQTTTGLISGIPTAAGTYPVALSAINAGGTGRSTVTLKVTSNPAIAAPAVTSALTATGQAGQAFTYRITASNNPTSYAANELPVGLVINIASGLITGTPTVVGTSFITLSAANASGTGTGTLVLTVAAEVPVVSFMVPGTNGGNSTVVTEGTAVKIRVSRTGGDSTQPLVVRYKPKGSNVAGTDYKALNGTVTIPAGATTAKIKVRAFDDAVQDGTKILKLKFVPSADGAYRIGAPLQVKIRIVDRQSIE